MQCSTSSIRKDSTIPYAENYLQPASGKSLRFREGTYYEDLDAICPAIMRANRVAVLKDCHLYFYRQHQGSYIHTFNLRRCDVLDVTRRLTATMESHYPRLAPAARSRELSANFNMLTLLAANSTSPEARALSDRCWIRIKEPARRIAAQPLCQIKKQDRNSLHLYRRQTARGDSRQGIMPINS